MQQVAKLNIAASGTEVFRVEVPYGGLAWLTIWAFSGQRPVDLTCQPRINGLPYDAATFIGPGTPALDVVYRAAVGVNDLIPGVTQRLVDAGIDPFVFDVEVTNNDATNAVSVTLCAVGQEVGR